VRPEWGLELAGIAQDRHQRADRRGAERDADEQLGDDEPCRLEHARDRDRDRGRQHPAARAEPRRPAADSIEVHLEAGQEEEERQADVAQEVDDAVGLREPEDLGADQDPERDLRDHDRHADPLRQVDEQRRKRGHEEDDEECTEFVRQGSIRLRRSGCMILQAPPRRIIPSG
jgi:hypothetical protein